MKAVFFIYETKCPSWVEEGRAEYLQKISPFLKIELKTVKSPEAARDEAAVKTKKEAELLLKFLSPQDYLVLFDEGGKKFSNSIKFADDLRRVVESQKERVVFVIGGPYGFDDSVKQRANARWSLSELTFNHWLAQLAALEQLYRGFTILRGIPYHNS